VAGTGNGGQPLPANTPATHPNPQGGIAAPPQHSEGGAADYKGQHLDKKRLPELHGDGGSLLNIVRVLLAPPRKAERTADLPGASSEGGAGDSDLEKAAVAARRAGYEAAHTFDAAPALAACASGRAAPEDGGGQLTRFTPGSFDTVVDTYGLCSHDDPVQACAVALPLK
jgi:hypothetical protein